MHGGKPIETPIELDAEARRIERALQYIRSPRLRFHTIIDFYIAVRKLPESWLQSYIVLLLPIISDLVAQPGLESCRPEKWAAALEFFSRFNEHSGNQDDDTDTILRLSWKNTILTHCYTGRLRELESLFIEYQRIEQALDEQSWQILFSNSDNLFDLTSALFLKLRFVSPTVEGAYKSAIESWKDFVNARFAVPIVLLETNLDSGDPVGNVLQLEVISDAEGHEHIHFRNELESEGSKTLTQLERARENARAIVHEVLGKPPTGKGLQFRFHDYAAKYTGDSLGLGAALCLTAYYSHTVNARLRWHLSPVTAAIGRLEPDGSVSATTNELIRQKIHLAFFSPVETVIVPGIHQEYAREVVSSLTSEYPNRILHVVGVNHLRDAFLKERGVTVEHRPAGKRSVEFAKHHRTPLVIATVVLLSFTAAYFAYQVYYGYPNLEIEKGINIATNAIVYNPRDSLEWCFRDEQRVMTPSVPFGDLEVGDSYTRNFWVWNMTPSDKDVLLRIDGVDSTQWFLNYKEGLQTVESTSSLRFSVMYNPLTKGDKHAWLSICDPDTKQPYYRLELTGSAGAPLPGGYAMRFDGIDDMVFFGRNSDAFTTEEATIEFWVKPYRFPSGAIVYNGSNFEDSEAPCNHYFNIINSDSIHFRLGNTENYISLPESETVQLQSWTHIALAYSKESGTIDVYKDGHRIHHLDEGFTFAQKHEPYVTIGAWNDARKISNLFCGELDEVRVWDRQLSQAEISQNMNRSLPFSTHGLIDYWNMDVNSADVMFTAIHTGHNGEPQHRPDLVRSSVPILPPVETPTLVDGPMETSALSLPPATYLVGGRNVLPLLSDATISFWFMSPDADSSAVFNFVNLDRYVLVKFANIHIPKTDTLFSYQKRPGWNHCLITRTLAGNYRIHMNGALIVEAKTYTIETNMYRFEGIQLGYYNDKYQSFGPKYGLSPYKDSRGTKCYSNLAIWSRLLTKDEIQQVYENNTIPETSLEALWPLNRLPDSNGNIYDKEHRYPLHFKQVRYWEEK